MPSARQAAESLRGAIPENLDPDPFFADRVRPVGAERHGHRNRARSGRERHGQRRERHAADLFAVEYFY
jgi:hypothetical protein